MRVGSLVECLDNNFSDDRTRWPNIPKKGRLYTIRAKRILDDLPGVLLEEFTNPEVRPGEERGFYEYHFREVQPPMDVSALIGDVLKVPTREHISTFEVPNEQRINKKGRRIRQWRMQ